jgi:hypothetical protein
MSHWDSESQVIVQWPTKPIEGYPGWLSVDCGCCAGISWGGDTPKQCSRCKGAGAVALHVQSRRVAEYPGGPLLGMWHQSDVDRAVAA